METQTGGTERVITAGVALAEFVREADRVVAAARSDVPPDAAQQRLAAALREALRDPGLVPAELSSLDVLPASGVAKFLLYRSDTLVVFTTVMAPSAGIPAHDHGSWGLVGVHHGVEEEVRYAAIDVGHPTVLGLAQGDRLVHRAGDVTLIRPPDADVHSVVNMGEQNSVSVHVFGRDVLATGFRMYAPAFLPLNTGPLEYDVLPPGPRP